MQYCQNCHEKIVNNTVNKCPRCQSNELLYGESLFSFLKEPITESFK